MKLLRFHFFILAALTLLTTGCGSDDGVAKKDASMVDSKAGDAKIADGALTPDTAAKFDVSQDSKLDIAKMDLPSTTDVPLAPDAPQQIDAGMDGGGPVLGDGGASLANVSALFSARCIGCHNGTGATTSRINLAETDTTGSTLRARLLAPLPLEAYCGIADGGVGTDADPQRAIVPGDPSQSFLYLKVMNMQPSPGAAPALCGTSMPRVRVQAPDGGAITAVACELAPGGAAANCLSAAELELIRQWILAGAP